MIRIIDFNKHYSQKKTSSSKKNFLFILLVTIIFGASLKSVLAQDSPSVLYVPLIGITSVPKPLALPNEGGNVTYNYAVKNFLSEVSLANVQVSDDKCSPVKFVEGDDNKDSRLDYSETWRYTCNTKLIRTTESSATARGTANNITATHKAYATVIVGSSNPAPLISIINATKVAYPLSLPAEGGRITFTYKVNNPGAVPLSGVTVTDDICNTIQGKLGDINDNNLLDTSEVWIYTCTGILNQTTTNTVNVSGFANGLKAIDNASITIKAETPIASSPALFDVAINPFMGTNNKINVIVWEILSGVLMVLIIFFALTRKRKFIKIQNKSKFRKRR